MSHDVMPHYPGKELEAMAFAVNYHRWIIGLDHGAGHFRPLSLTRQRRLLAYHDIAISHEGLCQVV